MKRILWVFPLITVLFMLFACATTAPPENPEITRINTVTAKEYFDRGVLFIDVRGDSYDEGHIPRSTNIYWNGEFNETVLSKAMSKHQEVVFYCDGPSHVACLLKPVGLLYPGVTIKFITIEMGI